MQKLFGNAKFNSTQLFILGQITTKVTAGLCTKPFSYIIKGQLVQVIYLKKPAD